MQLIIMAVTGLVAGVGMSTGQPVQSSKGCTTAHIDDILKMDDAKWIGHVDDYLDAMAAAGLSPVISQSGVNCMSCLMMLCGKRQPVAGEACGFACVAESGDVEGEDGKTEGKTDGTTDELWDESSYDTSFEASDKSSDASSGESSEKASDTTHSSGIAHTSDTPSNTEMQAMVAAMLQKQQDVEKLLVGVVNVADNVLLKLKEAISGTSQKTEGKSLKYLLATLPDSILMEILEHLQNQGL